MSILIKGMEMPKNCYDCPLFESIYHLHGCHAVPKSFDDMDMWNFTGDDRPLWCPLVSVPPHGDLIDRDALKKSLHEAFDDDDAHAFEWGAYWHHGVVVSIVNDAPTIIPAEKGIKKIF